VQLVDKDSAIIPGYDNFDVPKKHGDSQRAVSKTDENYEKMAFWIEYCLEEGRAKYDELVQSMFGNLALNNSLIR
jgi:hypothetical protein